MAEPTFERPDDDIAPDTPEAVAPMDVLPDGVERTKSGIPIFEFLDQGNLVDVADKIPGGLTQIAADALAAYDVAKQSMSKWEKLYKKALKLAKIEPEAQKKTFPFEDASQVMLPFILEAMLDFHSRTVPELVWAPEVVRMKAWGEASNAKADRADRVSTYMNYQLTDDIRHWRAEQDKMLLALPCVGTAYKQHYFNGNEQKVTSDLRFADEVIFDQSYRTFDEAPDYFLDEEYTRNEVLGFIRGVEDWDLDEDLLPMRRDHPDPFGFLRAFTWIDLDQDGLLEPYEVLIWREDQRVVAIYPCYDEDGIISNDDGETVEVNRCLVFTQYRFLPDPEGGPMGMGWGILLSDMFEAINANIRQIIDAGTLANLAGSSGLIDAQMSGGSGRGNRQQAGPIEVRMGELTPITTGGKPLAQSLVQFPYQGPNTTLFQVMEWLLTQVRDMTNSALNMDTNSQEAATMYLARLQQGLKIPNSIVMRVYDSARMEFKAIALLNFKHYSDGKYNRVLDGQERYSMRQDFNPADCDIRPATDPSQGADIERQQRATIVLEEAKQAAQIGAGNVWNLRKAYMDFAEAYKVPEVEALLPEPTGQPTPMEQAMLANMQREAELEEREMRLKEAKQDMERAREMMKALNEGAEFALKLDKTEAEIAKAYADAFEKLWQIGMAGDDPVATVQNMETRLIDRQPAPLPTPPQPSPDPNPTRPASPGAAGAPAGSAQPGESSPRQ